MQQAGDCGWMRSYIVPCTPNGDCALLLAAPQVAAIRRSDAPFRVVRHRRRYLNGNPSVRKKTYKLPYGLTRSGRLRPEVGSDHSHFPSRTTWRHRPSAHHGVQLQQGLSSEGSEGLAPSTRHARFQREEDSSARTVFPQLLWNNRTGTHERHLASQDVE